MSDVRLTDADERPDDVDFDRALRPQSITTFVGQDSARQKLSVFLTAARQRNEPLDHVLLAGPPGLGKTSLARIIAKELDVGFHTTSGPVIERKGDLAAILTAVKEHDVLFIDEIHRLGRAVEESALSGDGGLRDRHRHRSGPVGDHSAAPAAALHPCRRHDPHRAPVGAAARALRHRRTAELLHLPPARADRPAIGLAVGHRDRP